MTASQPTSYTRFQIFLHWAIAALILFQILFGESMGDLKRAIRNGTPDASTALMGNLHIWVGIAILALVAVRLLTRFFQGAPAPLPGSKAQELAAKAVHVLLYVVMIGAPVTGLLAWYGGVHTAEEIHEAAEPMIYVLVALHVVGAIYHHFVLRDGTLKRMVSSKA